ncbi:MAG TPA: outer membrane protein assembly factor BamC [Piscirickettsiaceae bacterium]|nr:outer membrane protein assembly factor BamC [Piscirickettsiaceae bacterium]HIQ40992.1 outer membrane protein assembly factor BamC [Sulfurivirga caldicuralii]
MKPVVGALLFAVGAVSLSGCSSFSKALNLEDSVWSSSNYRDQERALAESLETPPTLVKPQQNNSLALLDNQAVTRLGNQVVSSEVAQISQEAIPAYKAKGVAVEATLCERWLTLDEVSADMAWEGVQKFLKTLGLPIKEANRATGIIKTEYVQRKEIVPLLDVSPLRKLLNKWRPEVADGAMDRFTVHVTVDPNAQRAQIRFHHHQVFAVDDGDTEVYHVKPYDPVKELEILYQAAVFFGAHKEAALKQVKVSAHTVEIVKGEEIDGLILHAPLSQSWAYLQSMIWRADWQVVSVSPERHQMVVRLDGAEDKGFWSSMAFWRRDNGLPKQVVLQLKPVKDNPQQTLLQVDVPEGDTPMNQATRLRVFEKLGLLGQ